MLKIIQYSLLSSFLFISPLLEAVTLKIPLNQPVSQSAHFTYHRLTFDRNTAIVSDVRTVLTLKELNDDSLSFEALYDNLLYTYNHSNDNLGYETEEIFDSQNSKGSPKENKWKEISSQPYSFKVAANSIQAEGKSAFFPTYGEHVNYQGIFKALYYVTHNDIKVGNSFTFDVNNEKWTFKITKINNGNAHYSITIASNTFSGQGTGYWNINNALIGECKFNYNRIYNPNEDLIIHNTFSLISKKR